jgi:MoaA/NifB/PqqE/SkfB family radical SAM enzyme
MLKFRPAIFRLKKKPRLRGLVIKPTLKCTADCFGRASRRELHRSLFKERKLQFEDWRRILADAASLGLRSLGISGGEPTLYEDILKLVAAGRRHCSIVGINTNGSRITQSLAEELLEAGLTSVMISLLPADEAGARISQEKLRGPDEPRRIPDLHRKAASGRRRPLLGHVRTVAEP